MRYPTHSELRELTNQQRLQLLEDVWNTFVDDPDSLPLSDAHREELERRLKAMEQDPDAGSDWRDVKRRILRRG